MKDVNWPQCPSVFPFETTVILRKQSPECLFPRVLPPEEQHSAQCCTRALPAPWCWEAGDRAAWPRRLPFGTGNLQTPSKAHPCAHSGHDPAEGESLVHLISRSPWSTLEGVHTMVLTPLGNVSHRHYGLCQLLWFQRGVLKRCFKQLAIVPD